MFIHDIKQFAKNEKTTKDERNRTTKSTKIKTFEEKETYYYFEILEKDINKQAERKEKNLKRIFQENEETSRNQTT